MSTKDTFFINDRPQMVFEARVPNPYRFDDPDGLPGNPVGVEVRFFDSMNAEMVLIGLEEASFVDETSTYVNFVPMSEEERRGALIYIIIPPEVTSVAGRYTAYITTIYEDGIRITEDHKIDISEYR